MSAPSSDYEPEQGDESSESDAIKPANQPSAHEPISPPLQRRGSPASNPPRQRQTTPSQKAVSKTRSNALRRTKTLPVDWYLGLYNETVKDALNPAASDNEHDISRWSQHGVVTWTAEEKNRFFCGLSRKGKDAVPEIAAMVGTKSEMEVQDYIKLLHRSFELHETTGRNLKPVRLLDIPAALEIGSDCSDFLDQVAYASLLRDEQAHNIAGRRRHKDMWRIDGDVATYVEEQLFSEERDNTETSHGIFATARLFNIPKWVELSENVFMNPGKRRFEDNWTNLCLEEETPALTCDAFSDFYALAVSLTRRLVQSSIFFATSRIRALKPGGWDIKGFVNQSDVDAALSVLDMKPNADEFWRSAARRCELDIRTRKADNKLGLISYDEVEERLSGSFKRGSIFRPPSMSPSAPPFDDEEDSDDADANSTTRKSTASGSDLADTGPLSGHSTHPPDDNVSDPEENYASKLDHNASREAETQIWQRLGVDPPQSLSAGHNTCPSPVPEIKTESDDERPLHKPVAKRKARKELMDWRDGTLYQSEWESKIDQGKCQYRDNNKRQRVLDFKDYPS